MASSSSSSSVHVKNKTLFEHLAKVAFAHAKQLGADEAKFVANSERDISIVAESGAFTLANAHDSVSMGVLVHVGQKKGTASVNSADENELKKVVEAAITIATYSVEDEALGLPTQKIAKKARKLGGVFDPRVEKLTLSDLEKATRTALKGMQAYPEVVLERVEVAAGSTLHCLFNSHGIVQTELQSSVDWDFLGFAKHGDEVSGMDYGSGSSFRVVPLDKALSRDLQHLGEHLRQQLNPISPTAYRGPVIFSPHVVNDILLDVIWYHLSGAQVMDGQSRWAKKIGKRVINPGITIVDDPHNTKLSGASSYDQDGLPTKKQALIRNGALLQHAHSFYTAKRCGAKSNALAGGAHGICIAGGETPLKDFFKTKKGKSILYVHRFSGNTDPLTGDFSGVCKGSSLYADGKRLGPVVETMIAGNAFKILSSQLAISRETQCIDNDYICPHFLVGGISVSAQQA